MIIGIDTSRAYGSDKTGTENYSYYLIKELLRLPESRVHTFVLFTRLNTILPAEIYEYSNVIVKVVKWKYLWTQAGLAWETWKEPRLDVLWIPAHTLPILRNPKIKTVVTIHGLEYKWLKEYKNLLQRWYLPLSTFYAAKYAHKIIAVSDFTKSQLIKELYTTKEKIKVIHEGIMFSSIPVRQFSTKVMQKYGLEKSKFVLFVGTVQPRKNLIALVEAFSHFVSDSSRETVHDYKLVIAGGIGWMAEEIMKSPGKYNVQEKVVFTGRVADADLRELYESAAIYVQPSITEGFGLPILEAMSLGIPVVCSDGGALPEVAGEAAVIVSLGNNFVRDLGKAMKRVISDEKLQKSLISMGHERVKEFSWEKAARETLQLILG